MKKFSKRTVLSILAAAGGVVLTSSLAVGMASCSVSENGTSQQQSFNLEAMIASQETNANFKIVSQSENVSITSGDSATLVVNTDSTLQNSKQLVFEWWQDNGSGWKRIQAGAHNTYLVDATRGFSTLTHQRYRVNIFDKTNANNGLWSKEINVTILPKNIKNHVTVTQQPTSELSLKSGDSVSLKVGATISNNAQLKYQWFEDDGSGKGFQPIADATESTYNVQAWNNTTKDAVRKYLCRFADSADRNVPTKWLNESNVSTITISPQSSKISITSQSQTEQTITTTGATLITVEAKHSEGKPLTYEWYIDKGDDEGFQPVQFGSRPYLWIHNLDINGLKEEQTWNVYVDIFNKDDESDRVKSNTFTVDIKLDSDSTPTPTPQPPLPEPGPSPLPTPTPTPQPEGNETIQITKLTSTSSNVRPGERVTLTVEATSSLTSNLTYQWYKCEDKTTFQAIDGANSSTYTFNAESVTSEKEVMYKVTVSGAKISFESDYLELTIAPSNRLIAEKVSNPNGSISDNDLTLYGYQPNVNVNLDYTPKSPLGDAYKVNIRGNKSGITYQWYLGNYNGVWRDNADKIKIVGATQNTFTPDAEVFQKVHQEMGGRARVYCAIYKDGQLAAVAGNFTNFYLAVAAF